MSETTVFRFPGMVVTVHRPKLTEEERTKRMEAIRKQAVNLLKEVKA